MARGRVTHKPGAIRLDKYPLLVHAPKQWGEGIRTEDVGAPADEIHAAMARDGADAEAVARQFGTTAAHVWQAVAYVSLNPKPAAEKGR